MRTVDDVFEDINKLFEELRDVSGDSTLVGIVTIGRLEGNNLTVRGLHAFRGSAGLMLSMLENEIEFIFQELAKSDDEECCGD